MPDRALSSPAGCSTGWVPIMKQAPAFVFDSLRRGPVRGKNASRRRSSTLRTPSTPPWRSWPLSKRTRAACRGRPSGCRFWSQNISTFILISPRAKIPNVIYILAAKHQNTDVFRYFQLYSGKIRGIPRAHAEFRENHMKIEQQNAEVIICSELVKK